MPAFFLSGFTFPIQNMPASIQALSYLNPVRSGVSVLWPQMLVLGVYGVAILGLSAWRLQKRLD